MRLIGSIPSPYVRKVRVVLAEKEIAHHFQHGDVMVPDSPVLEWNPLGKIPCLVLDDGRTLFDSRVICEYLDLLDPAGGLLPPVGPLRIDVLRWQALADGVADAAILYRWEQTQRAPRYRDPAWLQRQSNKIVAGLRALSHELGSRTHCCNEAFSLADISLGCTLDWLAFRLPEFEWKNPYPNLNDFMTAILERPSFAHTPPNGTDRLYTAGGQTC